MSGRIDEGMNVYRELLAHLGLGMPATPRQLLREMIVTRLILRLRGLKFRERRADGSRRTCSSGWTPPRPSRWG